MEMRAFRCGRETGDETWDNHGEPQSVPAYSRMRRSLSASFRARYRLHSLERPVLSRGSSGTSDADRPAMPEPKQPRRESIARVSLRPDLLRQVLGGAEYSRRTFEARLEL